jgi:phosphoribosylformimino-5-aminoimidazole carboxamide ribotide isomerase
MAIIIPAIDLKDGEAVRLVKGDYAQKTVYSKEPAALARGFEGMGCEYLHIVDLDGAKDGVTVNRETIGKIRAAVAMPIQVGGGIRTAETVAYYLNELNINRVILGTAAVRDPDFLREMVKTHGASRIVAGVDMRSGKVAASGWLETSDVNYLDFAGELLQNGVEYVVATDISRDGTLTSPNYEMAEALKGLHVIVAGGVSCNADVLRARGHYGVIVGKAWYEGKVDLKECIRKMKGA